MNETTTEPAVVRPYGDTTGDGMAQLSFTLPVPAGPRAEAAARQLVEKMGMQRPLVAHARPVGDRHTFFVIYGQVKHVVEMSQVRVPQREYPLLGPGEVNTAVRRSLRRKLSVVGACIGTDAHTVGIDAILNLKGIAGEKGLEYYREFRVTNLGAQVSVEQLVAQARAEQADAVLVSQFVTQRDAHLHNVRELAAAVRQAYPPDARPVLVAGGPRFDQSHASDLGVDRVFGPGTTGREVASYLVHALCGAGRAVASDATRDADSGVAA